MARRFELMLIRWFAVYVRRQHIETFSCETLRELTRKASNFDLISIGKYNEAYELVNVCKNSKSSPKYSSIISGLLSLTYLKKFFPSSVT